MSSARLWIIGVLITTLAACGCANSPLRKNQIASGRGRKQTSPDSQRIPATSESTAGNSQTLAAATPPAMNQPATTSGGTIQNPQLTQPASPVRTQLTDAGSQPALPASRPTSPEQLTELDLQELDRALNNPNSNLPAPYKDYLRTQLNAIVGRSQTNSLGTPSTVHDSARNATAHSSLPTYADVAKYPVTAAPSGVAPAAFENRLPEAQPALTTTPVANLAAVPVAAATSKADAGQIKPMVDSGNLPTVKANGISAVPAHRPSEEVTKDEWRTHLLQAVDSLERELARSTPSEREEMRLATSARLLHLIANHRDKAVSAIEQLDDDEREYWKHQLLALLIAFDAEDKHASSRRAALTRRELSAASDHLSNLSTLDVRNLAFCDEVKSFGVYTPVKSQTFKPGQNVLLYVELDNFTVQQAGNKYETKFQAEYNILDGNGGRVNKKLNAIEELECRNRRHDFFISYQLEVPKDIRPGPYTLQLIIEDVIGQKSSEASIEFRVRN